MKKGQTVYLKTQGNLVRRNDKYKIIETSIKSMGRKYITVDYNEIKFNIDDLREKTEYCSNYALYEVKQLIFDEEEHGKLSHKIRMAFDSWSKNDFDLEQLRDVVKTLGLEEK